MAVYLIAIAILLGIGCAFIVSPAHADAPRIMQGDTVYLNGTYDISGVIGWGSRIGDYDYIAYCYGNDCYDYGSPYLLQLPPKARTPGMPSQYNYYIDPAIFSNKIGWWFQYDATDKAAHGNTYAFKVVGTYASDYMTLQNGTVINQSDWKVEDVMGVVTPKNVILPERAVSDYLLARGDAFSLNDNTTEKVWIFGRVSSLYDYTNEWGNYTFNGTVTSYLEPGSYHIIKQYPGKNGEFDVRYYSDMLQWRSGWTCVNQENINGIQPKLAKDNIIRAITNTDDTYVLEELEVQDPAITISGFDEVPMHTNYSRYEEYRLEPGLVSLFDVRGYSNLAPGTPVTVTLDENRHTPSDMRFFTFNATIERELLGNMSYYQVYIPIVWDKMALGMHNLKVAGPLGASMYYDFPISVLPADSFKPNATVKYAGDRNPWVPTPTPEVQITIIEKKVVVTQTVLVPVTPAVEVVKAQQDEVITEKVILIAEGIVVLIILILISLYVISVIKRARLE
jgi:hypothetical protein